MAELRKGYESVFGPSVDLERAGRPKDADVNTVEDVNETDRTLTYGKGPKITAHQEGGRCEDLRDAECWATTNEWALVDSSNVAAIAYDQFSSRLYVEFLGKGKGNSVYVYYGVGKETAMDMFNASSVGQFVWQRLRDKFSFLKIKG